MRLDGKISAIVDVVLEMPLRSVLEPLLFILYTSELFHIVGNYISAMRMILRSLFAESGFSSNQLLVFEVARDTQP